jgi:hypothetical protein
MSTTQWSTAEFLAATAGWIAMVLAVLGILAAGLLAFIVSTRNPNVFFWGLAAIVLGCANFLVGWGLAKRTLGGRWVFLPLLTSAVIVSPILWIDR